MKNLPRCHCEERSDEAIFLSFPRRRESRQVVVISLLLASNVMIILEEILLIGTFPTGFKKG